MKKGFTLAELLIALLILGVIATFTIPKVLQSQQNSKKNAAAKEAASMISGAYQAYKQNNTLTSAMKPADLTPYMNYVRIKTTGDIDTYSGTNNFICTLASQDGCLILHSGGALGLYNYTFNDTASTNAIPFMFDTNTQWDGQVTGETKGVRFVLYYNGRLSTFGTMATNTCDSNSCTNPVASRDPVWLSWN